MRGRRAWAILVAMGGVLFGALGLVSIVVTSAPPAGAMTPAAQQYLDRINAERARVGVPPLREDPELTALAQAWADQMAATQRPGHPPDITRGFSTEWLQVGDNFAFGPNVDSNWSQLLASPVHHGNIVNAGYTQVGIGVAIGPDGTEYVEQWFIQAAPAGADVSGGGGGGGRRAPAAVEPIVPAEPSGPVAEPLPAVDVVAPAVNLAVITSLEYGKAAIPSLTYGVASTGDTAAAPVAADDSSLSPWLLLVPLALLLLLLAALLAWRAQRSGRAG